MAKALYLIASYDTIMSYRPPYTITTEILKLVQEVSELVGQADTLDLSIPPTHLRRNNRIKSIHSSLVIEGNTLSQDQVSAILDKKRVLGPEQDIIEVQNAITIYKQLPSLDPAKKKDLLKAHKILMDGLVKNPGKFRRSEIGILKGTKVEHLAPPYHLINDNIKKLMSYVKKDAEIALIKSCVFHYEFEFLHPFEDGNGRMGRLWQTLILMKHHPLFEFLPIEHTIKKHQKQYYQALSASDKAGNSTAFITYMLARIKESLTALLEITEIKETFESRMEKAKSLLKNSSFNRKEYMKIHKRISSATASRDLKKAYDLSFLKKSGEKRNTVYKFK